MQTLLDDRIKALTTRSKRALPFKYTNSKGEIVVHLEIEDQSELLRGQIMILQELIELPSVVRKVADAEIEALARANKKENADGV